MRSGHVPRSGPLGARLSRSADKADGQLPQCCCAEATPRPGTWASRSTASWRWLSRLAISCSSWMICCSRNCNQQLVEQAMASDIERAELLAAVAQWIAVINQLTAEPEKPPEE